MGSSSEYHCWLHRLALALASLTWVMIFWGSLVTTMKAGDAVPDWPLSYGQLLPEMVGGIFYEHGHRMIGWALGLLAITTVIVFWKKEPRRWLRWLTVIALVAIVSQGLLGGLRVLLVSNPELQARVLEFFGAGNDVSRIRIPIAMIHGVSAQLVLCLITAIALATSKRWAERAGGERLETPGTDWVRAMCLLTVVAVLGQLTLGVYVRHGEIGALSAGVVAHFGGAFVVSVCVIASAILILRLEPDNGYLRTAAVWLLLLVISQVFLGIGSYVVRFSFEANTLHPGIVGFFRSGHVAVGALVFAGAVVAAIESFRVLKMEGKAETACQTAVASV